VKWWEVKCSEVKWTDLKRYDKTSVSGRKWKMGREVKWWEVKWTDLKRYDKSGRKWKMGIEMKWNEVKWWEVKCIEVKWTDLKRDAKTSESGRKWKMGSEVKWSGVKWSEAKIFGGMYVLSWTYSYAVCICVTAQYVAHLRQHNHNSKSIIFLEKSLNLLKCYNFLWVQRRHNCSPAASFANRVMTLYLLKVHL